MARTRKQRLAAEGAPAPVAPPRVVGISGTTNWRGDPLAEPNSKLLYAEAYGQAGQRDWGEWEEIARTDPDIATVLDFVVAPLRDARVDVEPAEHPSIAPAVAQAQADFCRRQLLESCEPRWPDVLEQMVRGKLTFGFSLHEVVLGDVVDPSLPGGRGWGLKRLADRLPSSVHPTNGWIEEMLPDGHRELAVIRQRGQLPDDGKGWSDDIQLPAGKVLLLTHNRTGNNYRGYSAFRPAWYIARIRRELLKLVGVGLVRESAGVPVAYSDDPGAILTPAQRKSLSKLLSNLVGHENASIVMPNGWKLDWVFSPGANKGHVVDAYNNLGNLILRLLGAQQISLGTGSTGSRSVGEVHNAVAQGMLQGQAASVEAVLNGTGSRPYTGLTRKLIDPNWGPQPAYPRITLTLKKAQLGPLEKMQALKTAVDAGAVTITADDENAVREELGLAPIEAQLRDTEKAKQVPVQPPVALPTRHPLARQPGAPWQPARPLRAEEKRVDFAAADAYLNRARVDFERALRPAVVHALVKAQPALQKAMADGDASDVAQVPLDFSGVLAEVRKFLAQVRSVGQSQVRKEVPRDSADTIAKQRAEGDQTLAPVRRLAEEGDDRDKQTPITDETDDLVEMQGTAVVRRMGNRLRSELEREAIDTLRTGGDASEVVSRTVQRQLDTGAFRADAGTVLTKVWNLGRDEAARVMGGVKSVQLSALLDGNQCSACEALDGEEAPFDSAAHDALLPPVRDCAGGDNCRCLLVYVPGEAADGGDE